VLSNIQENGWGHDPIPIKGFEFIGCAFTGTCRRPQNTTEHFVRRAENNEFDFIEPLPQALNVSGVLRTQLPPVNITIYNRGHWGVLSKDMAETILPLLYDFAGGELGRCFYRTTTASPKSDLYTQAENGYIQDAAFHSDCSLLDFAHVTKAFSSLKSSGKLCQGGGKLSNKMEWQGIYWDVVHFAPWVYEELNNLLLNVLCNHRPEGSLAAATE
jgi:hypothetical protein